MSHFQHTDLSDTRWVREISGSIRDVKALQQCEFLFPADTSEPIVALEVPRTNGFRCTFESEGESTCPHVCKTVKKMQEHS